MGDARSFKHICQDQTPLLIGTQAAPPHRGLARS